MLLKLCLYTFILPEKYERAFYPVSQKAPKLAEWSDRKARRCFPHVWRKHKKHLFLEACFQATALMVSIDWHLFVLFSLLLNWTKKYKYSHSKSLTHCAFYQSNTLDDNLSNFCNVLIFGRRLRFFCLLARRSQLDSKLLQQQKVAKWSNTLLPESRVAEVGGLSGSAK